jgi:hypothetical protein
MRGFTSIPSACTVLKCSDIFTLYEGLSQYMSQGNLVSFVSDYGLDNWDSIPGRGKGFFF